MMIKKCFFAALLSTISASTLAAVDSEGVDENWGCQIVLCLADPRGAETEKECRPPIAKLWRELAKGNGFPSCDFKSAAGNKNNHARNEWLNIDNCPAEYIRYTQDEKGEPYCLYVGVITVTVNNAAWTRVWWNWESNFTQNLGVPVFPAPTPTRTTR